VVGIAEKDLKNWCVSDEGTRKHADLVKSISSEQLLPDQQALEPGELALATSLDLGQYAERGFQLIRAEACFQMLTAELKLPFRKDSIEKILRDSLRRGQEPDLQLCGNLAAMLGLHVTGAHVPAAMGVRLQIPSLVRWKSSFALVHRSHSRGLILASPSDGFVELLSPWH
jgi:ATP-binding cassette subfamily B protein